MKSYIPVILILTFSSLVLSEQEHVISKRSGRTYTCSGYSCLNGVCSTRSYVGPNPPAWCQRSPFSQRSSYSWSKQCRNNVCSHKSNYHQTVHHSAEDVRNTFNVDCAKGRCSVQSCRRNVCGKPTTMSQFELDRDIRNIPRCTEHHRSKRSFLSWLSGYCCDVTERWGHKLIAIRPVRNAIGK